jgi:hypothetical protein
MDRQKLLQGFAGVPMVKLDSIGTLLSMKTKIMLMGFLGLSVNAIPFTVKWFPH